jgi:hypothetical protein
MLVEVNSTLIAATPAQSAAPNNRGNVKKKNPFTKKQQHNTAQQQQNFLFTVGNWPRVQMPSAPPPQFPNLRAEISREI